MNQLEIDHHWMRVAFELAHKAQLTDEVPVGAVLVQGCASQVSEPSDYEVLGEGYNQPISQHDATAHAEINAIRAACKKLGNYRLPDTTLYVTLEPCAMCAGAIIHSRISRVVIATKEPRAGAAGSALNILQHEKLNHRCEVTFGILQNDSAELLKAFFKQRRNKRSLNS